jgi:hypothetical protein
LRLGADVLTDGVMEDFQGWGGWQVRKKRVGGRGGEERRVFTWTKYEGEEQTAERGKDTRYYDDLWTSWKRKRSGLKGINGNCMHEMMWNWGG